MYKQWTRVVFMLILIAAYPVFPCAGEQAANSTSSSMTAPREITLSILVTKLGFTREPPVTVIVKPNDGGFTGNVTAFFADDVLADPGNDATGDPTGHPVAFAELMVAESDDPSLKGLTSISRENGSFTLVLRGVDSTVGGKNLKQMDFRLSLDTSPFRQLAEARDKLSSSGRIPYLDVDRLAKNCIPVILSGDTRSVQAVQKAFQYEERLLREFALFKEKLEHSTDRLAAVLLPLLSGLDAWWCARTIPEPAVITGPPFSLSRSTMALCSPTLPIGRFATTTIISLWDILECESLLHTHDSVQGGPYPVWDIIVSSCLKAIKSEASTEQFTRHLKQGFVKEFLRRAEKQLEAVIPALRAFSIEDTHITHLQEQARKLSTGGILHKDIISQAETKFVAVTPLTDDNLIEWWERQVVPNSADVLSRLTNELLLILEAPVLLTGTHTTAPSDTRVLLRHERKELEVFLDREKIRFLELSFSIKRTLSTPYSPKKCAELEQHLEKWLGYSVFHYHLIHSLLRFGQLKEWNSVKDIFGVQGRINHTFTLLLEELSSRATAHIQTSHPDDRSPEPRSPEPLSPELSSTAQRFERLAGDIAGLLVMYENVLSDLRNTVCAARFPVQPCVVLLRTGIRGREHGTTRKQQEYSLLLEMVNMGLGSQGQTIVLLKSDEPSTWEWSQVAAEPEVAFLDISRFDTTVSVSASTDRPRFLEITVSIGKSDSGSGEIISLPSGTLYPPVIKTLDFNTAAGEQPVIQLTISENGTSPAAVGMWFDAAPLQGEADGTFPPTLSFPVPHTIKPGTRYVRVAVANVDGRVAAAGRLIRVPGPGWIGRTAWVIVIVVVISLLVTFRARGIKELERLIRKRTLKSQLQELKQLYREKLISLGKQLLSYPEADPETESLPPRLKEIHNDCERLLADRRDISGSIDGVLKEEAVVGEFSGTWEKVKSMVSHLKELKDELARLDEAIESAYLFAGRAVSEEKWSEKIDYRIAAELHELAVTIEQIRRNLHETRARIQTVEKSDERTNDTSGSVPDGLSS